MITRKQFLFSSLGAVAAGRLRAAAPALKIGHRQASMTKQAGPVVFEIARSIPGLSGVELQVHYQGTTLWDRETLLAYKRAAREAGMQLPSIAGVWTGGASFMDPAAGEEQLRKAIQAAEGLGARVILAAGFKNRCPNMNDEASYGPVVAMLQKVAPAATDAGVTIGLETSLNPQDDCKLVDLVNRPSVRVYYDAHNCEFYGHKGQAVPGYEALGKGRLAQIHLKNESRLLEEPGLVDWTAALKVIRRTGYDGWFVFETSHPNPEQCVEATRKNIAFIQRQFAG